MRWIPGHSGCRRCVGAAVHAVQVVRRLQISAGLFDALRERHLGRIRTGVHPVVRLPDGHGSWRPGPQRRSQSQKTSSPPCEGRANAAPTCLLAVATGHDLQRIAVWAKPTLSIPYPPWTPAPDGDAHSSCERGQPSHSTAWHPRLRIQSPIVAPANPQRTTGQPLVRANPLISLVGVAGFELATPCTPCKCATRLRYTPTEP